MRFLLTVVAALFLFAFGAQADSPGDARRHFENGVRLAQDHNYAGALVEFEASFDLNPTAVALQNMAVCQKALFRYADAVATLERLLRDHAKELSPEDRKAAEDAAREMRALLGRLVVRTVPPDARVTINDKPLDANAAGSAILLAPGEYRVGAQAPGYARAEQTVTVTSGDTERVVELRLLRPMGTLHVTADNPSAAIAVDGSHVGYDQWTGSVAAGAHEIVVYTDKLRSRTTATVAEGQTAGVEIKLEPTEDRAPPAYEPLQSAYVPPQQRGRYAALLLAFGGLTTPRGGVLDPNGTVAQRSGSTGGMFGAVVGNRFSDRWQGEAWVAFGANSFTTACDAGSTTGQGGACSDGQFDVVSGRIGVNGRVSTAGRRARLFGLLGLGVVGHSTRVKDATGASLRTRNDASPLAKIGGGIEVDFGRWFASGALEFGGEMLRGWDDRLYGVGTEALELRFGYAHW